MPRFDLATPADIRFGAGRVSELPEALAALGARRILIVTGRSTERAVTVRSALGKQGIASTTYSVGGEPTVELVRAAVRQCRADGNDAVLGFGGGSALDVAKAVAALAVTGADPLDHLEVIGAGRPLTDPGLPCAAVPTTAGTGSEVTRNAVLSGDGVKASLRGSVLLPRLAIVDPDLLSGLPRDTVAASGMDALAQLIEPFLSRRANPVTDALARDGIRRSARSLRRAYADGMADPQVRDDLALASLFGGLCLANAGLGVVHGLAAAAGARLGAPHGAVCAAALAPALAANVAALRARAPDHPALARAEELATLVTGRADAAGDDLIAWAAELTVALDISGLRAYGLDEVLVPEVVAATQRASSTKANPIDLTDVEVTDFVVDSL